MRRIVKWSLRGFAALLILIVLFVSALATILNTPGGTRWALTRIDAVLPGALAIESFEGTLWRGLKLPELRYKDADLEIAASEIVIKIDWSGVLAGRIVLQDLGASAIGILDTSAPDPVARPFTLAMNPLPLDLGLVRGAVGKLTLTKSGATRLIENVHVANARLDGNTIRARAITASMSNINLVAEDMQVRLEGNVPAAAEISWALGTGEWSGQGPVNGSLESLNFEHTVTGPYPATLSGTVALLNRIEPEVDAVIRWDDWSFSGYRVLNGSVEVRGTAGQYDADYNARVLLPDARELRVAGRATGTTEQLTAFAAQVESDWGHADLQGELAWSPEFSLAADVQATGMDPAAFVSALSGELDASTKLKVDNTGAVTLNALTIGGVLNDAAIRASGDLLLGAERMQCHACSVKVGENLLRIDGYSSDGRLDLSVNVDATNLEQLWPNIAGMANGQGRVTGSQERPRFSGELKARQLHLGEMTASSVEITSKESSLDSLDVRAALAELNIGEVDYGSFNAHGQGSPEQLQLDLQWQVRNLRVDAQASLQTTGTDLTGGINRATINEPQTGNWKLAEPLLFSVGDKALSIQAHNWSGDSGELRISRLVYADGDAELTASIENLPLSLANAFLPAGFGLLGSATAQVELIWQAGLLSGTVDWEQADTVLRVAGANDQTTDVRMPRANLHANFRDGGVAAKAAVSIEPGVTGEVDFALDKLDADARLEAELRLQGDDWSWISAVVPEIDGFKGGVAALVNARGPVLAPEFSGDLVWSDGGILIPAFNVPLEDINVRISGAPDGTATLVGSAKAGSGTLSVDGKFDELMQTTRSVILNVGGASAEVVNWPEYRAWATPDITIVGDATGWKIGGELLVPRARIEIREIPVEAVRVSEDAVVIGDEVTDRKPTRIEAAARITLGEKVRVKALGLDTGLTGTLLVRLRPDRDTTAEGKIQLIDGSFATRGQRLAIKKGELTFTGPLDDPIVDVRAVRVIETFEGTITAGIHLYGRAQNLSSSVFSEPAMNEVDALSYLVLGRPLSQATESEGGELSGAAVSLGLRQATVLTEQIGQSLGLDQLSLSGDGGDTTALIAGKKINSRLYARYAYGVFSRIGTVLLRYRLSSRLTLEAGAGENQSIVILYSVEK